MWACSVFLSLFFQPTVKWQIDENSNHQVTVLPFWYTHILLHIASSDSLPLVFALPFTIYKICFDILLFSFYSSQNMPCCKQCLLLLEFISSNAQNGLQFSFTLYHVVFLRNTSIVVGSQMKKNINVILKSDIPISICVYSNIQSWWRMRFKLLSGY